PRCAARGARTRTEWGTHGAPPLPIPRLRRRTGSLSTGRSSSRPARPGEQTQVDRVGHRLVAGIARMQVVARVVGREKLLRIARIARRLVEIDHAVVRLS